MSVGARAPSLVSRQYNTLANEEGALKKIIQGR